MNATSIRRPHLVYRELSSKGRPVCFSCKGSGRR